MAIIASGSVGTLPTHDITQRVQQGVAGNREDPAPGGRGGGQLRVPRIRRELSSENADRSIAVAGLMLAESAMTTQSREAFGLIARLIQPSRFDQPVAYTGLVVPTPGNISINEPVLRSLWKCATSFTPVWHQSLTALRGRRVLSLEPPSNIQEMHAAFRNGCATGGADMAVVVLCRALTEGAAGLGPKRICGDLSAADCLVQLGRSSELGGDDELCSIVSDLVFAGTRRNDTAATRRDDMHLRLGAAWLMAMERQKDVGRSARLFVAASVAMSGLQGWSFDTLSQTLAGHLFGGGNLDAAQKWGAALVDATASFMPQVWDVAIMSRFSRLDAGSTLADLVPTREDVRMALASGLLAVAGSLPQAVVNRMAQDSDFLGAFSRLVVGQVAMLACAALAPYELAEEEAALHAGVIQATQEGLLSPAPVGESGKDFVERLVGRAMAVRSDTETAQKSLAYAGAQATAGWLARMAVLPQLAVTLLEHTAYSPVQALSLYAASFAAKHLGGADHWVTTDARKDEQLICLVLDCAAQGKAPTDADLRGIYQPRGELLGPIGRGLNRAMQATGHAVSAVVRSGAEILGGPRPRRRLDYGAVERGSEQA